MFARKQARDGDADMAGASLGGISLLPGEREELHILLQSGPLLFARACLYPWFLFVLGLHHLCPSCQEATAVASNWQGKDGEFKETTYTGLQSEVL